jgi:hypothetical protein
MTIRDVINKMQRHPAVTSCIAIEAQMGFPAAALHNDRLCLQFFYYNTKLSEERILLYEPRYLLKTVYPFNQITKMEDLTFNPKYAHKDFLSPGGSIEITPDLVAAQHKNIDKLFTLGDKLLEHCERHEMIPQEELREYQLQLYKTINPVHLQTYKDETE